MWPHAVLVDEWLRGLAASRGARAALAAGLALAVAVPLVLAAAFGEAPNAPPPPHVRQDPQVGPPELESHDVFLGFRPRIEYRPGANLPVLRQRTPLRPRLELPEPVELASREAVPPPARFAASGASYSAAPARFAAAGRPLAAPIPELPGPALLSLPPAPLPRRAEDGSDPTERAPSAAPAPTLLPAPPAGPASTVLRAPPAGPTRTLLPAPPAGSAPTLQPAPPAGPARVPTAPAASASLVAWAPGRTAASLATATAGAAATAAAPASPGSVADPIAPQAGSFVGGPVAFLPQRSATGAPAVDRNARPVGTARLEIGLSGAAAQASDALLGASTLEFPGPLDAPPAAGFASHPAAAPPARASDALAGLAISTAPEWIGGNHFSAMANVDPVGDALRVQTIPTGFAISAIPEPATGALLALGLAALAPAGRRR